VFDALKAWRRDRARAADVPAYVVFSDQTLRALAKHQPASRAQLANMPGIGPAKLERFADDVLQVIAAHR
jgi:DNA helicase-2/ATP-dependent DNA helicase PcrA